jgi:hypothetical protein
MVSAAMNFRGADRFCTSSNFLTASFLTLPPPLSSSWPPPTRPA